MRPLIGVTTSEVRVSESVRPVAEGDPPRHEMVLGMAYARAVRLAGGIPVVLPPIAPEDVPALLDRLQGVILSGGPDVHPGAYRARPTAELGPTEPALDDFELALARAADAAGVPILGICRGCQVLNVARGGTLHQHLPAVTDGSIEHRRPAADREPGHVVELAARSRLARIVGAAALPVNSFHHQAADRLGTGLRAVAWSPDGVIEAIEPIDAIADPTAKLYLGVQWHAETMVERHEHGALFRALVEAAAVPRLQAAA
ncbi:MAG: putative glutamine amidotransferase [Solirubrobacteraceae bacterium]|jgi:putative glutamine amidotransferase|nr:putative glutamine amidotransferase [Solirubrobacteraceae bacterium]